MTVFSGARKSSRLEEMGAAQGKGRVQSGDSAAATSRAPAEPGANHGPSFGRGNLFGDINTIAESWFRQKWYDVSGKSSSKDVCTPQELVASASERGIEVHYEQRKVSTLGAKDFPCVVLDKAGRSTILTARPTPEQFLCQSNGQVHHVSLRELAASHSGVVFFVSPRHDPSVHDPSAPKELGKDEKPTLIRAVVEEIRRAHKRKMVELCIAAGLSNLFLLAMPMFSMSVYDRVIPHLAMETLWALAIGVAIALVFDFAMRAIRVKLSDAIGLSVSTMIQARLYNRLLRAKLGQINTPAGGIQTSMREVEGLAQALPALFVSLAIDLPFFLLTTVLLFAIAGPISLVPMAGLVAIGLVQFFGDTRGDKALAAARLNATQANLLLESINGIETVKIAAAARPLTRRWERLVDGAAYVGHANRLHSAVAAQAAIGISQAAVVAGMVIGVYLIAENAMSMGALSATTLLIGRMMSPMSQFGAGVHRVIQITRSSKTVEKILQAELESGGDPNAASRPIQGRLRFENVGFTYPGEQTPALRDINLTIEPGEKIGLIGRAGSGKSTLLRLILRLHDPSTGAVLLDDHDIRQAPPEILRRHFGFMTQDAALFDDTLRNAVCFGLDRVTEEAFEKAVDLAGVKEFASRHPSGYGMRIGARGERLSGGERQSVMLARTLVANPSALLLDEPTASMDNTTEIKIVRDLREILTKRTLIVSTHRAPLLALVDRIIWLERGAIVADGPKEQVLQKLMGKTG